MLNNLAVLFPSSPPSPSAIRDAVEDFVDMIFPPPENQFSQKNKEDTQSEDDTKEELARKAAEFPTFVSIEEDVVRTAITPPTFVSIVPPKSLKEVPSIAMQEDKNILEDGLKVYKNRLLGRGSYGSVYYGEYFDHPVAIKVLHDFLNHDYVEENFKKEISILQKCDHPNITYFYGCVVTQQESQFVMELLPHRLFIIIQC